MPTQTEVVALTALCLHLLVTYCVLLAHRRYYGIMVCTCQKLRPAVSVESLSNAQSSSFSSSRYLSACTDLARYVSHLTKSCQL